MNQTLIKIILAILLLLGLFDMPYGFYQFVRFSSFVGFSFLAFKASQHQKQKEIVIYLALGILFQPFIKIALGRFLWNLVDLLVGVGLILNVLYIKKSS